MYIKPSGIHMPREQPQYENETFADFHWLLLKISDLSFSLFFAAFGVFRASLQDSADSGVKTGFGKVGNTEMQKSWQKYD